MDKEENKNLFDKVEKSAPKNGFDGVKIISRDDEEDDADDGAPMTTDDESLVAVGFKPKVSKMSKEVKEKTFGVKKTMDGAILTIASAEITAPKQFDIVNGERVILAPKLTKSKKAEYYDSKLKIRFVEDNIVEYYPKISIWVNDGKLAEEVNLGRDLNTKVAQICRMALQKMSKNAFKLTTKQINDRTVVVVTDDTKKAYEAFSKTISDDDILTWLVGQKVKITTSTGDYDGHAWMRNDVAEFVD